MDRNTITGLVVIALILIGYSYFMSPSKEELKAMHVDVYKRQFVATRYIQVNNFAS